MLDVRCVRCRGDTFLEALGLEVEDVHAYVQCHRCENRVLVSIPFKEPAPLILQMTDLDCPERC